MTDATHEALMLQNARFNASQQMAMNAAMQAMPIAPQRRRWYAPDPKQPFTKSFYKNAIASGSIVPPLGESASVRRSDFLVGCVVCLFVALAVGGFVAAMLIGRH